MNYHKKLIYVAGPYTDDDFDVVKENVRIAALVSQELWRNGFVAICPHLNTYEFDVGKNPHTTFLVGDFEIIKRCDAVLMLPGWEESMGAYAEHIFAKWLGKPVVYMEVKDD